MEYKTDVQIAVEALTTKTVLYDQWWAYYNGAQKLVYSSRRLSEIFAGLDARFTQNWCAVVVDSVLDRMELRTPTVVDNESESDVLADAWDAAGLTDDEYSVHEDLCITGEAFVIVQESDAGFEAFYNDARLVHVEYEPDNPRRKRFAAKWWIDAERHARLTLYYPDRFEYYHTQQEYTDGATLSDKSFTLEEVSRNVRSMIPVFHFRSTPRGARSQMANVVELQDAINKLLADMMVAAEYGAFKQRYIISQSGITKPDGTSRLQNRPNEIWDIPAGESGMQETSVGEFSPTDLDNYLKSISDLAAAIGIISRTPRHYFYAQGGDPSGEALIAMEAPLTRKVTRLQKTIVPIWKDIALYLLGSEEDIDAAYEEVETVQPLTQAQIYKALREAGLPLPTVLKLDGWTEADLDEVQDDTTTLIPPADQKLLREVAVMDQQLGIASKQTLAQQAGYDYEDEQSKMEEEDTDDDDAMLTSLARGAAGELPQSLTNGVAAPAQPAQTPAVPVGGVSA
jgi:hypothetical protein